MRYWLTPHYHHGVGDDDGVDGDGDEDDVVVDVLSFSSSYAFGSRG